MGVNKLNLEKLKLKILSMTFSGEFNKNNIINNDTVREIENIMLEKDKKYKSKNDGRIPESWRYFYVEEIIDVRNGFTPLREDSSLWSDDEICWFTVDDYNEQGYEINSTRQHISKKALTQESKRVLPANTVILCCTSATIGTSAIGRIPLTTNQQFNGLVIKDEFKNFILPEYLYYYTLTLKPLLMKNSSSSTFPFVSVKKVNRFLIPIPPVEIQEKIVSFLDTIMVYLSELEKRYKLLKTYKSKIYKKIYKMASNGEFSEKNVKWKTDTLFNILPYEQPTKYIVNSTKYDNSFKTPVLTAGKTFILGYTNEEEGIYNSGDVIIFDDFTTDSKYVNFPFKVKSSAMKILKPRSDMNPKFCYYLIQSCDFDASTHKRYWISEYSKIKISYPPINEQNKIVKKVDEILNLIDQI